MIGVFPSAMFPWLQFRLLGFFAPTLGRLWLRFRRRLVPQHVRESLGFLPEPALAIPYRRLAFAVPYSHNVIDGTPFKGRQMIAAIGVGNDGKKMVLGLREGATE